MILFWNSNASLALAVPSVSIAAKSALISAVLLVLN